MGYVLIVLCVVFLTELYANNENFPEAYGPTLAPTFLPVKTNLTYNKGQLVELYCAVANLGTKSVTWRKLPYITPIITGKKNFANDRRYQSHNVPYKDEWNLLIRNAQPIDSGVYECQVSDRDKLLRQNITLTVRDTPDTMVLHDSIKIRHEGYYPHFETEIKPDINVTGTDFVERGDPIYLVCNATGEEFPPDDIQWFKDGQKIKSDPRQKLSVKKEVKMRSRSLVSALEIQQASMHDAGTYVCRTTSGNLTKGFTVNVLNAGTSNVKRGSNGQVGMHESKPRTPNHSSKKDSSTATDNAVYWSSTSKIVISLIFGHYVLQRLLLDL